jgi:hypothetical protein
MARWRTVVAMSADRNPFEGDAFSDAVCAAFCDAVRPHHPWRADRLRIAAFPGNEQVRQVGVFGISSSAFAGDPLCDPFCGPFCGPSRTDHPFVTKGPQIGIFQRSEKVRQWGVLRGSRRARGVSCATSSGSRAQPCCTSARSESTFLSWNGYDSSLSAQGTTRAAAQTRVRAPRRRLRCSGSGGWSR